MVKLPVCGIQQTPLTSTSQNGLGSLQVGMKECLYNPTLDPQMVPSRQSEIDDNKSSGKWTSALTNSEIRILKNKITYDNNLDGLLELENRFEPGISETIESRLERDNLVQDPPGTEINLAHLPEKFKMGYNELFAKYNAAFSKDSFDIGCFTGFGQGITLDVQAGKAFQKERPIKGVDACLLYTSPSPRDLP